MCSRLPAQPAADRLPWSETEGGDQVIPVDERGGGWGRQSNTDIKDESPLDRLPALGLDESPSRIVAADFLDRDCNSLPSHPEVLREQHFECPSGVIDPDDESFEEVDSDHAVEAAAFV